jgi:enoyl-CoA hydratase
MFKMLPNFHQLRRLLSTTTTTSTSTTPTVVGSNSGHIGHIVIHNPAKLNAMTLQMYKDIPTACQNSSTAQTRVTILSGVGTKAFGAGSDIAEFPQVRTGAQQAAAYSKHEDNASESLQALAHPLLAKIHGPCYGGALNIALTADLRYASEDATFCVPPAKLGIGYPRSLMKLLVNAVGKTNAKELLFTAAVINAQEAKDMGLINRVVPKDELDDHVTQVAMQIAQLAPLTIASCKMELQNSDMAAEQAYKECYESQDYEVGVHSFLEKRCPKFTGD